MAQFFPARTSCLHRMTSGEKRLAERLEKKLEDDYLCWYDVPVGPKALRPDFIVLHPLRGWLVLEVKDWKLDTIATIDKSEARIVVHGGIKKVKNPMLQASVYALETAKVLEQDPRLVREGGSAYQGKLIMPFAWGVVLSNITRQQFESTDLGEVLQPVRVICKDEMTESVDDEAFQERLWGMFHHVFPCQLTLPQIDRVRWHLFPEVRVNPQPGQFGLPWETSPESVPDLVKVMDLQQEQLARSLGAGHRVIHGAAGSGKTMILGYRAAYLSQLSSKPVLVLCYNKALAARLQQVMGERGLGEQVVVRHFHGWCSDMLRAFHVPKPANKGNAGQYVAALVETTMAGVERGQIPRAQYSAVLIDEGHDFEPDWFRLVVQMIDPDTDSLLVLYDDAQSIYHRKKRELDFSFASVGIQARGRTTILKVNYRNTAEVLSVAKLFASELLSETTGDDDGVPTIAPETAGRSGPFPELIRCEGHWQQMDCVVQRIVDANGQGRDYDDIAVIYRSGKQASALERALKGAGVPVTSTASRSGKTGLYADGQTVKLVSMHSSKGLEFGLVIIPDLCQMPKKGESESDEARLLYVAMTRAMEHLVMTCRDESAFTQRVADSIQAVARRSQAEATGSGQAA